MASAMIHYSISNLLLNELKVQNAVPFLLGAVLGPDASSHEDGTYDTAHFGGESEDKMRKGINWKKFTDKYEKQIFANDFVLGYYCHLLQDALWFHEIADKYVRCYQGEEKKLAYQRGYRDYDRLNYLLIKEFHLKKIDFTETEIPIDEISAEKLLVGEKNFKQWFDAIPCDKEDLDIYTWDVIEQYIKKCVRFCISEVNALKNGEKGCDPENLFAKA